MLKIILIEPLFHILFYFKREDKGGIMITKILIVDDSTTDQSYGDIGHLLSEFLADLHEVLIFIEVNYMQDKRADKS